MAKSDYVVASPPLPAHGKRGAKPGPRRTDFAPYLSHANEGLQNGTYGSVESAAYKVAKEASRKDGVAFDALKSFLRYHLNSN